MEPKFNTSDTNPWFLVAVWLVALVGIESADFSLGLFGGMLPLPGNGVLWNEVHCCQFEVVELSSFAIIHSTVGHGGLWFRVLALNHIEEVADPCDFEQKLEGNLI